MKNKKIGTIVLIGILVIILISIIIAIIKLESKPDLEGYGFEYEIPGGYKFKVIATDMSAVDGPSYSYYVYDNEIIYTKSHSGPLAHSLKATVYEDVDTSNIEYKKEIKSKGIIEGDNTTIEQIREAIKNKKGKTVCDYTEYYNF